MRVSLQLTVTLLILGVILLPQLVFATNVVITEIMYSPSGADSGYEWVEVHNQSGSGITLTNWNLRENKTDHRISSDGVQTVAPDEFAVIADDPQKVKSTYSQITSPVFDSTFSLNNGGEPIAIITPDGSVADNVNYSPDDGADGDGNSLQLSESGWVSADPTPQEESVNTQTSNDSESTSANGSDNDSAPAILQPRVEKPDDKHNKGAASTNDTKTVVVDAGSDLHSIAGVQLHLEGVATTSVSEDAGDAEVFWSLGNGDTKQSADIFYTYQHPGTYVATLVYRSEDSRRTDKVTVNVDAANELQISDRKSGSEGYTKISNSSGRDINLSGWHLRSGTDTKTLPDYTIVLANKTVTLDNHATELTGQSIQLLYPDGTVADSYYLNKSTTTKPSTVSRASDELKSNQTQTGGQTSSSSKSITPRKLEKRATGTVHNLESLFATSSQSAAAGAAETANLWRWVIVTAAVIIGGVATAIIASGLQETRERDLLSDTFDITEM